MPDTTNREITALSVLADICAALGVGNRPMLSELPGIVLALRALAVRQHTVLSSAHGMGMLPGCEACKTQPAEKQNCHITALLSEGRALLGKEVE